MTASASLSFSITVADTINYDGTWGSTDYRGFYWFTDTELDLSRELVGQPTSTGPWGTNGESEGDFNAVALSSDAPSAVAQYFLGIGYVPEEQVQLRLTSFRPYPVPEPSGIVATFVLMLTLVTRRHRRQR